MAPRPLKADASPDHRPQLGVAVVGLGVGEEHVRAFLAEPRCRLTWLHDLDRERSRRAADRMGAPGVAVGAPRVADRFEDVLRDPATHVVSIASYDDAHAEQVVAALEAGKHVFVEKPLCRNPVELSAIRRAWARAPDRHLASNLVLRGAPLWRWLRESIAAGRLGRIYAFDGDYLYGRIEKITEGWRKDVVDYSVIQGGGIHLVDLMLWLTGERPCTASAAGNRLSTEGTAFRYPDFVAATYTFPSGLVGRVTANFGCVHRHQHVVRVFGTEGTFLYDDRGPRLHSSRSPESPPTEVGLAPLPPTKGVLIGDFVRRIDQGGPVEQGARLDLDDLAVCFATDRALAAGHSVPIEYP